MLIVAKILLHLLYYCTTQYWMYSCYGEIMKYDWSVERYFDFPFAANI